MLESEIEKLFKKEAERREWLTYKFNSGVVGVPDRLLIAKGLVVFVELKTDTGKLSKVQVQQISRMRKQGAWVEVLNGALAIKTFFQQLDLRMMVYGV